MAPTSAAKSDYMLDVGSLVTPNVPSTPVLSTLPFAPTLRFHPSFSTITTDGEGRVTSAQDLAENTDANLPAGNEGPLTVTDAAGNDVWRFDGAQMLNIDASFVSGTRDTTVIAVTRDPGQQYTSYIFGLGSVDEGTQTNTINTALFMRSLNGDVRTIACGDELGSNASNPEPLAPGAQLHVAASTSTSTGVTLQMNSVQSQGLALTFNVAGLAGAEIGRYPNNSTYGIFDLYELVVYSPALTAVEMDAVVNQLMTDHGIVDFDSQLILEGDSIMAGTGTTLGTKNPSMIASEPGRSIVPNNYRVLNRSASGNGISHLITQRDNGENPFDFTFVGDNVVIFEIGRNDLNSRTAAAEYADIVSYINTTTTGLLQRGMKVGVMTNISTGSDFETEIVALRALLLAPQFLDDCDANTGDTFDGMVTVIATHLIEDGGAGARPFDDHPPDPAYIQGDNTHPNPVGALIRLTGGDTPQHGIATAL